jgi:hypothetical protein
MTPRPIPNVPFIEVRFSNVQTFCLLLLCFTVGMFNVQAARVYLGDVYITIFFCVVFLRVLSSARYPHTRWVLIGVISIGLGVAFDFLNRTPSDDILRGGLRNFVFIFMSLATCAALEVYGRRRAALYIIAVLCSLPFFVILLDPQVAGNVDRLFRWDNGIFLLLPAQLVLTHLLGARKIRLIVGAALFLAMGAGAYFMDIRSLAGMLWGAAFIEIVCIYKYLPRILRIPMLILASFLFFAAAVLIYSEVSTFDYDVYQRRTASDTLRLDMAADAWAGYLQSPFIGNGSWQHARLFTDPTKTETLIGVHSTVIQFAYEYGTLGLLAGCVLLVIHVVALFKVISLHRLYATDWLYGYLLLLGFYHIIMSPFAGAQRFTLGISTGIAFSMLLRSGRHIWVLPEFIQRRPQ